MTKLKILPFTLAVCVLASACSTGHPKPEADPAQGGSFEITYFFGEHGEHRLTGSSPANHPVLAAYLERQIIEERALGVDKFDPYFAKVLAFAKHPARTLSEDHECRSPYQVVAKIDNKTYTYKGCRNRTDDTSFSKLLREGEFLLYSKK